MQILKISHCMEIAVQDINLIWMQIYEPYHGQRYTSAQIYLKEFLSFLWNSCNTDYLWKQLLRCSLFSCSVTVSGQLTPEENCPPPRLVIGFELGKGLPLGLGGNFPRWQLSQNLLQHGQLKSWNNSFIKLFSHFKFMLLIQMLFHAHTLFKN